MLILPRTDCDMVMESTIDLKNVPKTIDTIFSEPNEASPVDTIKTSPSPSGDHHNLSPEQHSQPPFQQLPPPQQHHRRYQHHQKDFRQHQQQPRQPHHNWDINDSSLPVPERHDPFDLWPVGHCRRVYRGDIDDARRHISGWAMRNTNNHNALILKKSCLGVLICSNDCMLDNGKKVHFRPAICDKARRKQIGKPCPNPGCCGRLTLLPCRGHCGYPVTHFWRQLKGSVFFQAKGYHDHPRPDIKSLSEKGRNALTKHIRHSLAPLVLHTSKRRHAPFPHDELPMKKMSLKEKEVMCSCPPFECNCKQLQLPQKAKRGMPHPTNAPVFNTVMQPAGSFPLPQESFPTGPVTQINITNTCIPPHTNLGVNIPYTPNTFMPSNPRFHHPNSGMPEDQHYPYLTFSESDLPPHSSSEMITPHPPAYHSQEELKSRNPQVPFSDFHGRQHDTMSLEHPPLFPMNTNEHCVNKSTPFDNLQTPRTPNQYTNQRVTSDINSPIGSEHDIKHEHYQPNFLIPYEVPHYDSRTPLENRSQSDLSAQQNPAFLPDFNALSFALSPTLHPRDCSDSRDNERPEESYNRSSHSRDNQTHNPQNEQRHRLDHEQNQEMNVHQPTFITLTTPEKHISCEQNQMSPHPTPCSVENLHCHSAHTTQNIRANSSTPIHSVHLGSSDSALMHLGNSNYEPLQPMPHNLGSGNSEPSHISEAPVNNVPCSNTLTPPPSHHDLSSLPGHQHQQHILPNEGAGLAHYHHPPMYTNTPPPTSSFNPYCGDLFQSPQNHHPQTYQNPQQHGHQNQHQQRRNSINITLTYN